MNLFWLYDLPTWLFGVLIVGVAVAVGLVGFYPTRKWVRKVHVEEHSQFSGFLGLMIFLLADMDYPFRGEISVGPEAFELVYEQLMNPEK
jgi:hypothetical protein